MYIYTFIVFLLPKADKNTRIYLYYTHAHTHTLMKI